MCTFNIVKHNCGCIISLVWQLWAEVNALMAIYASSVDFLFAMALAVGRPWPWRHPLGR